MLTAQQKQEWVDALRSGKYTQTRDELFNDNKFCCLGVLQALHNDELKLDFNGRKWSVPDTGILMRLRSEDRKVLAHMNDHDKASFTEIADWIEVNIEAEG